LNEFVEKLNKDAYNLRMILSLRDLDIDSSSKHKVLTCPFRTASKC
jgi:hypothetical protein